MHADENPELARFRRIAAFTVRLAHPIFVEAASWREEDATPTELLEIVTELEEMVWQNCAGPELSDENLRWAKAMAQLLPDAVDPEFPDYWVAGYLRLLCAAIAVSLGDVEEREHLLTEAWNIVASVPSYVGGPEDEDIDRETRAQFDAHLQSIEATTDEAILVQMIEDSPFHEWAPTFAENAFSPQEEEEAEEEEA